MNDWAKGRLKRMNWARGRRMCLELQLLTLHMSMYVLVRNINWAQGRLMYIVPMYILYLILFTGLSLTLIHVIVGEPREAQTQSQ